MIVALVVLAAAPACGPLDLPTALSLAAARSDEVAIKHAELVGARADEAIAKAAGILPLSSATLSGGLVPEAHGDIFFSPNSNRTLLRGLGPWGRIDINVVQPLWTWGQLSAAKEAAQAGVQGRTLAIEDQVHQVQLRVAQLYWSAALARRLLSLAAEVEDSLQQVEQKIAQSLAAADGSVTQEDKFRVAVFRGELGQRRSEAQKGLRLARAALAATLAIGERELQLKDEALPAAPDIQIPDQDRALQEAERDRPDLRALDQAILALEAQVRANRAAQLPQIFAAGYFAYSLAPNRDIQTNPWVHDDFNLLAGGVVVGFKQNLAFPLLRAQVDKSEADLAKVRTERQGLARLVGLQAGQAVADLAAAVDKHESAKGALSAGRSWFRSAVLNFGIGVADARGLIEAYTGYIKTQLDNAQATFELLVARSHLDQVTGKSLASGEPKCVLP
jgi:outer membrane protein TolC